jgi:hypothetical protein
VHETFAAFWPLAFPENRENSREFANFLAISALPEVNSSNHFSALHANSLVIRNRNFFSREQGNSSLEQGISAPLTGFMEATSWFAPGKGTGSA